MKISRHGFWFCLPAMGLLIWSGNSEAQVGTCGVARGITPYATTETCLPKLTFHVSGQCLTACGVVFQEFTSPDVTALGFCNIFGTYCPPAFVEKDRFDPLSREYYSRSAHRTPECKNGQQVRTSSGFCPCVACAPAGPGTVINTTPGEDPLLISIDDTVYRLTSAADGVRFDLNADGHAEATAWTARGSDEAFLVLDRNFNGLIDDGLEIFGDETAQLPSLEPNGFRALAVFDDPLSGGNGDGKIDRADSIFSSLMLWTDRNHDGISDSGELQGLEGFVTAIDLAYQRSETTDEFGNDLRYWSTLERPMGSHGAIHALNVFFVQE